MVALKLKFKIEILHKLNKILNADDLSNDLYSTLKTKNKIMQYRSADKSFNKNSRIITNDADSIPGYEQEIGNLPNEQKVEIDNYLKTFDFSSLYFIITNLKSKSLFGLLCSSTGLDIISSVYKNIFKSNNKHNNLNDNKEDSLFYQNIISNGNITLNTDNPVIPNECELYYYLKDILEISELEVMDLFDLITENFQFTEITFTLLIYLLASFECGNLYDYFQMFGENLFNVISRGEKIISCFRLKEMCKLFIESEITIVQILNELNYNTFSQITYDQFIIFYNKAAKLYDEKFKCDNKIIEANIVGLNKQTGKSEIGCINKACNIL